jgi:hypothetical protein
MTSKYRYGRFVVVTFSKGHVSVWHGTHGWFKVPENDPVAVNRGHIYPSYAQAYRAIERMRKRYPHGPGPLNATAHELSELWDGDNLRWDLIKGQMALAKSD